MHEMQEQQTRDFNILPQKAVAVIAGLAIAAAPTPRPETAEARPLDGHPAPHIESDSGKIKPAPDLHPDYSKPRLKWLLRLRICESGNDYNINTGNGYYGAYQFSAPTWRSLKTGYAYAHHAPPKVQDKAIVKNTFRSSGGLATQNPGCYKKMKLSKLPPK